ncbi:MAG TPA: hypothetical protein VGQ86_04290, partial [Candidatus Limnocylindria bacterium]|nr:hypothetical protein [Candidatus Limnocylindria bacterium]
MARAASDSTRSARTVGDLRPTVHELYRVARRTRAHADPAVPRREARAAAGGLEPRRESVTPFAGIRSRSVAPGEPRKLTLGHAASFQAELFRRLAVRTFLASLMVLPSLLAAQSAPPLKYAPKATTAAITAGDLMSRLYIFADDSMKGRETGTRGHVVSTAYIARELRRMGLQPAGDNGTFFQDVPLVNRPFDPTKSTIAVEGVALIPGVDFIPQQFRGLPRTFDGAQVIYGGTYGDTAGLPSVDQLRGKVVVFAGGRPGFTPPAFNTAFSGAAALVRASGARLPAAQVRSATWPTANMLMRGASQTDAPLTILATDRAVEILLGTPLAQATVGVPGKTVRGSIAFAEAAAPARNVVAVLRGRDPKRRNTYVAIGAHSDHIGILPGDALDHDSLHVYNEARFAIVGMVPRGVQPTGAQRARVDSIRVDVDSLHRSR